MPPCDCPCHNLETHEVEIEDITVRLSPSIAKISKLLCKFEYDDDINTYVSDLMRRYALTAKDEGGESFDKYVQQVLKDEDW